MVSVFVVDICLIALNKLILLFLLLSNFIFLYFFDVLFSYLTLIWELRFSSKKLFRSCGALVKKCVPKKCTLNNYKGISFSKLS